ncbi:unnamed protein product [Calypogeia fissa]
MALPEVQIELFENGKGPRHTFKTKLQGWEANRLDLETIQNTYHLKAVYAYSITAGRGQRLAYHPRNGLSLVCYSGKPGVVIRLDSDPKLAVRKYVLKFGVGVVVAAFLLFCFHKEAWPQWLHNLVNCTGGGFGWIVAFLVFVGTQAAAGWGLRRKTRATTR